MPAFRSALVTGASSGIGRALALELARRGTWVSLAARRTERLEQLAREVEAAGGRARVEALDVRDTEAVGRAVRAADEAAPGGLDLVVANAGVGSVVPPDQLDWEAVADVLAVNVVGAAATLFSALPLFRERRAGTLVGVSSLAGVRALPGSGAYSASKAALSTLLESLEIDLRDTGVRVVDVQPGFVRTAMTERNEFRMPFLLELDDAVRRTVAGLESGRSVVSYPWQLAWPLKVGARVLPRGVWRGLTKRAKG